MQSGKILPIFWGSILPPSSGPDGKLTEQVENSKQNNFTILVACLLCLLFYPEDYSALKRQ
jgi:hypothetical protein